MYVGVSWYVNGLRSFNAESYVVVDVLRFSTLVVTALAVGFKEIYVFSDLDKAVEFRDRVRSPLAAEVDGIKPDVADLDNSPTGVIEYVSKYGIGNGKLVIRTTSGALIVSEAIKLGLRNVFIGSLVNARAIARVINELKFKSVNIVCAGYRRSDFSIEDFLGAGAIIYELSTLTSDLDLTDEAIAALHTFKSVINDNVLLDVIKSGRGGSFLWRTGRERDVVFASNLNKFDVVPQLVDNVIREYSRVKNEVGLTTTS